MSVTVIGACSLCGGRVTVPFVWFGIVPPTARCESCGAIEMSRLPVIPMQPAPRIQRSGNTAPSDLSGRHTTTSESALVVTFDDDGELRFGPYTAPSQGRYKIGSSAEGGGK